MTRAPEFVSRAATVLLAGCAGASIASAAAAQSAPAPAPQDAAPTPAASSAAADIVVTATRRSERLQDVPIAVSAVDAKTIASRKIDNFAAITKIAPGPTFVPVKGTSLITVQIRGQQTINDATGLENPIGIYIDDVYYGTLASFDANLFDVSQIAVLRGPQGTTFGRNAVGGALQITDNPAVIGETSGKMSLTGLRYEGGQAGIESDGYVNAPLADNAAIRLAYSVKNDDGYQKNLYDGKNLSDNRVASFRGSVTWDPTDRLRVMASASYTGRWGLGDGYVPYGPGAISARWRAASGGDFHKVLNDDDGLTRRNIFASVVHIDYKTDIGTISSITGYRYLGARNDDDADGSDLPLNYPSINTNKEKQVSEELRFTSNWGGPFSLLAGVYASYEDLAHAITFGFNGTYPQSYLSVLTKGQYLIQVADSRIKNRSVGPYMEGKYKLTSKLSITAGIRYSYERKSGFVSHVGSSPFYGGPYYVNLPGPGGLDHWDAFTPRFIVNYTPVKDVMVYASASKGFQGGGWTMVKPTAASALIPLKAETTWSYEIGTKSTFFDRLLTTNIAAFLADTSNLQVRSLVGGTLTDSNAGKQRVKGVEAEITLRPVHGLSLGANYAYTDSFYRSFEGCAAGGVSCSGNQTPFVSKNDFTFLLDYDREFGNGAEVAFHFDDQFASPYQLVATNVQQSVVPLTRRRNVANTSLTFTPPGGRWDIRLWARNLFDKQYVSNGLAYNFYLASPAEVAAAGGLGKIDVEKLIVAPPRTIGITATIRFGKS